MENKKHYQKKMPILWWTKRASYLHFVTRELTSLGVAYAATILLALLMALSAGEKSYNHFISILQNPAIKLLSLIAFAGLIFHSITWFNLAPKAMSVKIGHFRVPDLWIIILNYLGWLAISLMIYWILFG